MEEARRLRERIVEVLCEEWEKARPGILQSETIYERLVAEGEEVPDGMINEILTALNNTGAIRAGGLHGREEIRKHGAWAISEVRADLLC